MFSKFSREVWIGIRITLVITVVCGIAYPLLMTGVAQVAFKNQANGSLVTDSKGNVIGSSLIGQCYYKTSTDKSGNVTAQTVTDKAGNDLYYVVDPRFFQGRPQWVWTAGTDAKGNSIKQLIQPPCEAAPTGTNANGSEGSNLGSSNPVLVNAVTAYTAYLYSLGVSVNSDGSKAPMPVDLVTGDFTGFDPDISEAAALAQVNMVAKARHLDPAKLTQLVTTQEQGRSLGIFGSPYVNVLALNMALNDGGAN